jgi:glyoxylase-like metal-dependent hydrolase (beta-lactamase superfamily II)
MPDDVVGQIVDGLWRFVAVHPDWTDGEGGEGWDPRVSWWVAAVPEGLVLIDPLVEDWQALDQLLSDRGCVGIIRTCHWHQRSVAEAASRYGAPVWAALDPRGRKRRPIDHELHDQDEIFGALRVIYVERDDEVALWLAEQRALVFGDAMIRGGTGELQVCPESWTQPAGGPARLRTLLNGLTELAPEHVFVSHGPLVLGDGLASLAAATS